MPGLIDLDRPAATASYRAASRALRHVPGDHFNFFNRPALVRGTAPLTVMQLSTTPNNASVSFRVSRILTLMHRVAPFQAVGIDAVEGWADLSGLRNKPRAEIDALVRGNQLTGPLHFALTVTTPPPVFGLETQQAFRSALQAQRDLIPLQSAAAAYLRPLKAAARGWPDDNRPELPLPLARPGRWVALLDSILTLGCKYPEWAEAQPWMERFGPGAFERELTAARGVTGLPEPDEPARRAFDAGCRFYSWAVRRGELFAETVVGLMTQHRATWLAAVFTGFQEEIFLNAVHRAGVATIAATPNFEFNPGKDESVNFF